MTFAIGNIWLRAQRKFRQLTIFFHSAKIEFSLSYLKELKIEFHYVVGVQANLCGEAIQTYISLVNGTCRLESSRSNNVQFDVTWPHR